MPHAPYHAMGLMIAVLCILAIAYRYYSAFLAAKVAVLDDSVETPAYRHNDGQNYHPTNRWVLFGHHFAAISGAGPLIGPVLAAQFGFMPGLIWILVGVTLAGAVQDFLVLAFSTRRDGRGLAQMCYDEVGKPAGAAAMIGILFILVIALAGLGVVVVKALGGETVNYTPGTQFVGERPGSVLVTEPDGNSLTYKVPAKTVIRYPNKVEAVVSSPFYLRITPKDSTVGAIHLESPNGTLTNVLEVTPAVTAKQSIRGSAWGLFTIGCTIPIALFVGWYMYRFRKGKVVEASVIGAVLTLAAVWLGSFANDPSSWLNGIYPFYDVLNLSGFQVSVAMAVYGFIASVLPVWLLLAPRDYLSSFLKIGTIALLVVGVIVANPVLNAPAVNTHFLGGGPVLGAVSPIFPFLFTTIMCGAISGFHALVSSGTTPKMVEKESHTRAIGYGAMLVEGLVGVVALIAAASLPQSTYFEMNTATADVPKYQAQFNQFKAEEDKFAQLANQPSDIDSLPVVENRVGENLRGRVGGAVTLAVGMTEIFDKASKNVLGKTSAMVLNLAPYWYHFAIMFEALFILTTIDAGTRIGRFLLQEIFGHFKPAWGRPGHWPSAVVATALVVSGWFYFMNSDNFAAIWKMFGIANQVLAVIALTVVTVIIIRLGRARYAWVTFLPLLFVIATTSTAATEMLAMRWRLLNAPATTHAEALNAVISGSLILAIGLCTAVVLFGAVHRVLRERKNPTLTPSPVDEPAAV